MQAVDAQQLRFFLAVIDHEGFSRAAEQLYVAQPSLSQAIAGLERELGVALFHLQRPSERRNVCGAGGDRRP